MKRDIASISRDDDSHSEGGIADGIEHPNHNESNHSNHRVGGAEENVADERSADPFLPDAVLYIIFQFHGDSNDVVLTRKVAKEAIEDAAEESLRKMSQRFHVGDASKWQSRLLARSGTRIQEYYNKYGGGPPKGVVRTNTPRLRLCCAKTLPLSTHESRDLFLASAALLPNENIAFFCEDGNFRLYNVSQGAFYQTTFARGNDDDWPGHDLYYSNGYLLVNHMHFMEPGHYSVWNADDLTFVRDIYAGLSQASCVDAENGKIILVTGDVPVLSIVSIDISSGEEDAYFRPIRMENPEDCAHVQVGLSGRNIIIAAFVKESEDFRSDGLGIYIKDRDRPSSAHRYFPCFELATFIEMPLTMASGHWPFIIPFRYENDSTSTLRAIRFVRGQGEELSPVVDNNFILLGDPSGEPSTLVVKITETRLFIHDDEREEIEVDEYDIESGKKVRTICLGYSTDSDLAYVDATENVLFCMITGAHGVGIIQTFVL